MAIYHLTASTGSIRNGQSARAKYDYVAREGDYAKREDKLLHAESGHMPSWAADDPALYWQSADDFERANARLFKEIEFALPIELTLEQNIALARQFAEELTGNVDGGKLPFTLAVHGGFDHNPHCHLVLSERVNDAIDRGPDTWFKRVATGKSAKPENGGARKTASLKRAEWLEETRERWSRLANKALEAAGHDARIDHRSLADQGIARKPGEHLGPQASAFEKRTGRKSNRRNFIEVRQAQSRDLGAKSRVADSRIRVAKTSLAGLNKAAVDSIKLIDSLAQALRRWRNFIESQREVAEHIERKPRIDVQAAIAQSKARRAEAEHRHSLERKADRAINTGKSRAIGLDAAAELGDITRIERIICDGVDPTVNNGSAFELAAKSGRDDVFLTLLRGLPVQDHIDISDLAKRFSPAAAAKLNELAKVAKASGIDAALGRKTTESGSGFGVKSRGPKGPS